MQLTAAAASVDPRIRARAALAAGRIGGKVAAALLLPLLGDPDAEVRRTAAFALGEADDASVAGILSRSLAPAAEVDPRTRALAAEALGKLRADPQAEALTALLDPRSGDPDPDVRAAALFAVWKVASHGVAAHAIAIARADDDRGNAPRTAPDGWSLRARAVYCLMRLAEATTFPAEKPHRPVVTDEEAAAIGETLEALTTDADPQIRQDAARGLGLLKRDSSLLRLTSLAADGDWGCRVNALRALAGFGARAPLTPFVAGLEDVNPNVVATALEGLGGRGGTEALAPIETRLGDPWPRLRDLAAQALAKAAPGEAAQRLPTLAGADPDWTVRAGAAEAIATLAAPPSPPAPSSAREPGSASNPPALTPDPQAVARSEASRAALVRALGAERDPRALARMLSAALALDPPAADPRPYLTHEDPIVRATALEGVGRRTAAARAALVAPDGDASPSARPGSPDVLPWPSYAAMAASAPRSAGSPSPLSARLTAYGELLVGLRELGSGLRRARGDSLNDARLTVLDGEAPLLPAREEVDPLGPLPSDLAAVLAPRSDKATGDGAVGSGASGGAGSRADGAGTAGGDPTSRSSLKDLSDRWPHVAALLSDFTEALADPDRLVRLRAATLLHDRCGLVADAAVGEEASRFTDEDYKRALAGRDGELRARIETAGGVVEIALAPEEAPLTVANFVELVRRGYFNGHVWHRVVPNFVVQDGCPRGDGNGGPGWAIRCEINRLRYGRGAVGMALAGKDTGGSQFFITHAPQPHLDGGYTIFGNVVSGMEVVDRIRQGDRIERILLLDELVKVPAMTRMGMPRTQKR